MSLSPSSPPLATIYRGSVAASSVAIGFVFGLIVLLGYFVFSSREFSSDLTVAVPLFLFLAAFPGLFALVGVMGIRRRLRIFDAGVEGRGLFAPARFVSFSEAVGLSWFRSQGRTGPTNTHVFVNARVRGPHGSTAFIVPEPADPAMLVWARDRLCEEIAGRALEALQRGEAFEWCGVSLRHDGLSRPGGAVVAYFTPFRETLDGTRYTLALAGSGETVFKTKLSSLNFYPGWTLFHRLAPTVERQQP